MYRTSDGRDFDIDSNPGRGQSSCAPVHSAVPIEKAGRHRLQHSRAVVARSRTDRERDRSLLAMLHGGIIIIIIMLHGGVTT